MGSDILKPGRQSHSVTEWVIAFCRDNPRLTLIVVLTAFSLLFLRTDRLDTYTDDFTASASDGVDRSAGWFDGYFKAREPEVVLKQRPARAEQSGKLPRLRKGKAMAAGPGHNANNAPPGEDNADVLGDDVEGDAYVLVGVQGPGSGSMRNEVREVPRFDVFAVALKSGVDVVHERATAQLRTFLKPIRNLIIVGDGEATVEGRKMIDVVKTAVYGPKDQDPLFLAGKAKKAAPKAAEKDAITVDESSEGWKADGHKNLPGLQELWERFPDASWFVMVDDDSYVFFDNLLGRLNMYDPDGRHYFGAKTQFVGCDGVTSWGAGPFFAHGGSGIVLSRGAMRELMDDIDACTVRYRTCWAGDIRTALCLRDQGILLHSPTGFYSTPPNSNFWFPHDPCERPLTFHHLLAKQVNALYATERAIADRTAGSTGAVTFGDVFWNWHPESELQTDFDRKGSDFASGGVSSADDCKLECGDRKNCLAFVYDGTKCWLKSVIAPGVAVRGITSGVLKERYVCNTKRNGF
ncbi:hypothetical protein HKX48_004128 [Thoreauomyces humboldtii]|nr:hypothetical protein HKX48_004128 [Thoreauomyces humboldtii]